MKKAEKRWNNNLWYVRSKHHISIIKNDASSIANYEDGYWDGVDGGKNEAGDGNNYYCDVNVVSVLKLIMTIV